MSPRGPELATRLAFAAALRELAAVHRRDQARLLRRACALAPRGARRRWDAACAEEIASARIDGFPVEPLLPRLLALPAMGWPRASALARAALALDPGHAGRLVLARAWLLEGDAPGAVEVLRALLAERPLPHLRPGVLAALALALELAGRHGEALAGYAAAVSEPRSDPGVAVALLALALRVGDRPAADLAMRRLAPLDLTIAGMRRRFERALREAKERSRLGAGAAASGRDEDLRRTILESVLAGPRACSEVARELL